MGKPVHAFLKPYVKKPNPKILGSIIFGLDTPMRGPLNQGKENTYHIQN